MEEPVAKKEPVAAVKKDTAQVSCRRRPSPPPLVCRILVSVLVIRPLFFPTPSGARLQARGGKESSQQKDGAGAPTPRL